MSLKVGESIASYLFSMIYRECVDDVEAEDNIVDTDMAVDDVNPPNISAGSPSCLPPLVQPLLALVHPTPLSFPPLASPSRHPPTTSALGSIHVCAFECLNNVFLSLGASPNHAVAADKESGKKLWDDVWLALSAVGTESGLGQERRREMWEVAIGVLWGIGNVWKGSLVRNGPVKLWVL
jgi:hypothetical protein